MTAIHRQKCNACGDGKHPCEFLVLEEGTEFLGMDEMKYCPWERDQVMNYDEGRAEPGAEPE